MTCAICGNTLTGRQQRYCGTKCSRRAYLEARKADGRLREQRRKHAARRKAWQDANDRRYYVDKLCLCGKTFTSSKYLDQVFCSRSCARWFENGSCPLAPDHPAMQTRPSAAERTESARLASRSPLTIALDDGDSEGALRIIRSMTRRTPLGCWEWNRKTNDGYGVVNAQGKRVLVHRLVCELVHGALGMQPAHHICANSRCVNPEHLQPVTHRENIAEMLQRNYYIARILELEAALRVVAPGDAALQVVSLGMTA